eukprot:Gb_11619 [translate_table: standard]
MRNPLQLKKVSTRSSIRGVDDIMSCLVKPMALESYTSTLNDISLSHWMCNKNVEQPLESAPSNHTSLHLDIGLLTPSSPIFDATPTYIEHHEITPLNELVFHLDHDNGPQFDSKPIFNTERDTSSSITPNIFSTPVGDGKDDDICMPFPELHNDKIMSSILKEKFATMLDDLVCSSMVTRKKKRDNSFKVAPRNATTRKKTCLTPKYEKFKGKSVMYHNPSFYSLSIAHNKHPRACTFRH